MIQFPLYRITGENCSIDGQYIVYATLNKKGNLLSKYSNVIFRISIPESNSICEVNIDKTNVEMICQNEDKFYNSKIIIERQTIQDSEGKELFFIDTYESSNEFACDISLLFYSTTTKEDDDSSRWKIFNLKKDYSLSKGAIAAIVIVIIAVIAILFFIIFFFKKKNESNKDKSNKISDSTITNLKSRV